MQWKHCWIFLVAVLMGAQSPQVPETKPQQSTITIKVNKAGMFSTFAHNHLIKAPIARVNVDAARLAGEITVMARDMKVVDPEVSDKDRAEIQNTMLGPKVLDQEKYPEIHFVTTRVEPGTVPQTFRVTGTLELHGTKREMSFVVARTLDHYHGAPRLKQSDFGIKPVSLLGGSVKVKDELELEFDVYANTSQAK